MNTTPEPGPNAPVPPDPVVTTDWLAEHLDDDGLLVVDASVVQVSGFDGSPQYITGHEQYLIEGHIPGAVFADLIDEFSDPEGSYGFARPDAARFRRAVAELGIGEQTRVVVYDTGIGTWAARLWWLLRSFGLENAAVLDGGLTAWRAQGRPLARGHVAPAPVEPPRVREHPGSWVGVDDVAAVLDGRAAGTLVCAAPAKEFSGQVSYRARPGHIPGSTSVPAHRLVDRETARLRPLDELRTLFGDTLTASGRLILYCTGGVASCADALVLRLLGRDDVAVYDGSLNEWAADPARPLATG